MLLYFQNDDWSYFEWLRDHPTSYVLNVRRRPDPNYVVLHRTSCPSISNRNVEAGAYTERDYAKYCARTIETLRHGARSEGRRDGSFSKRCGMCKP